MLMVQNGLCFVSDETVTAETQDLFLAVLICSKHWKDGEFNDFCETADFETMGKEWGEKIGKQIAEDFANGIQFDINEKIKLFAQYVKESARPVKYWTLSEDSNGGSGAHWTESVLLTCTGQLGYSRPEALDAPLELVLADYMKHAESNGIIQLMTPEEIAEVEALEKEETCST